uniref:PIPK domain-containing protein n=1 Tax=Globisporangium ultimum (strain ATCC 200006 / CBS 805.95 / DAOM BR144) TaxID=431595 RepID=K3X549_GLOUD
MHFIIMASVFDTPLEIHSRFDLKGSKIGRRATQKERNSNGVLKDMDLLDSGFRLQMGAERRGMLLVQIRKDVEFLKRMKIMDYSMLIGIHDTQQAIHTTILGNLKAADQKAATSKSVPTSPTRTSNDPELSLTGGGIPPSLFCRDEGGIYGRDRFGRKNGFVYFIGVIDILQQYNSRKIAETFFKGLRHNRKQISAVNPNFYGDRFIEFMEKHVVQDDTLAPLPSAVAHSSQMQHHQHHQQL